MEARNAPVDRLVRQASCKQNYLLLNVKIGRTNNYHTSVNRVLIAYYKLRALVGSV
jgi:hypothetical protein